MPTYDVDYVAIVTRRIFKQMAVSAESAEEAVEDLQAFYEREFGGDVIDDVEVEIMVSNITKYDDD